MLYVNKCNMYICSEQKKAQPCGFRESKREQFKVKREQFKVKREQFKVKRGTI